MKMRNSKYLIFNTKYQRGQAVVTLLFFMVMSITITTAAVVIVLANAISASTNEQGMTAYYVAESGAEEAVLRLLRNPSYTGGTLSVGNGTVTINIASGTITATGSAYNAKRTVEVRTVYNNGVRSITSWKEL